MNAPAVARSLDSDSIPDVIDLALKIADEAARSDIECECEHHSGDAAEGWWYDSTQIDPLWNDDRTFIDDAIRYLELRGKLRRKPGLPHIVGFVRE